MLAGVERAPGAAADAARGLDSENATDLESVMSLADEFDYEVIGDTLDLRKPRVSGNTLDLGRPKAPTDDTDREAKTSRAAPDDLCFGAFSVHCSKEPDQKNAPRVSRHAVKDFPKHMSAAGTLAENVDHSDQAGENVDHVEKCRAGPAVLQASSDKAKCEIGDLATGNKVDETEDGRPQPFDQGHGRREKESSIGDRLFSKCRRWKNAAPLTFILTTVRDGNARIPRATVPVPARLALYTSYLALVPILGILLLLGLQMYRWAAVAPPTAELISLVARDEFVPITVIPISVQHAVHENEQPKASQGSQSDDAGGSSDCTSYAEGLREAAQVKFRDIWASLGAAESQWPQEVLRYLAPLSESGRAAGETVFAWVATTRDATRRWIREGTETARAYYEAAKKAAGEVGGWSGHRERTGSTVARRLGNYFDSDKLSQTLSDVAATTLRRAESWTRSAARVTRIYYEGCRDAAAFSTDRPDYSKWAIATWGKVVNSFQAKAEVFANLRSELYWHADRIWFAATKPVANRVSQVASNLERAKQVVAKWKGWERIKLKVSSFAGKWNIGKAVPRDPEPVHVEDNVGNREAARPALGKYTRWMEAPIATILSDLSRGSSARQAARSTTSYRLREFADGALARVHLGKEWMWRAVARTFGVKETSMSAPDHQTRRQEKAGEEKGHSARTRWESDGAGEGLGRQKPEDRSRRAAFGDAVQAAFAALVGGLI